MGGPGMAQRVHRGAFVVAAFFQGGVESVLHAAPGYWLGGLRQIDVVTAFCRKKQRRIAMRNPVLAQQLQGSFRQRDVTVLGALAVADVNHKAGAIDVGHAQMGSFLQTQAAGVDGGETNSVARQSDVTENLTHLREVQDDGQLLLRRWSYQTEGGPIFFQRALKEKLDAADGDGRSVA